MDSRKWVVAVLALLAGLAGRAQPPAEVILFDGSFEMKSPTEATYTVRTRIRVNAETGLGAAVFAEYSDEYRALTAFSGSVVSGGKVVRKLRKQDVITQLQTAALAEKTYLNVFEPAAPYPFEVEYDYTMTYRKAIATFPSFVPVPGYDIPVRQASYSLSVPVSVPVSYKASSEPEHRTEKGRDSYRWQVRDIPGTPHEDGMPEMMEWAPFVYACPERFSYDGTTGSQRSWEDIAAWNYSILPKEASLPEDVRREVLALTAGCESDLDKLRVLYGYLREHSRYVSIQLGIGGYVPASPEEVARTGYGDCKALTFFMKQLLSLVGIPSDYAIVSTRRKDLLPGYASLGQMDHALLRVPMQRDTVWLECTNPTLPLGYCHSGIAGHQALLVRPDGGKLVRIPDRPDVTAREDVASAVSLDPDGSATLSVRDRVAADFSEAYADFQEWKQTDRQRMLLAGLQCHPDHFTLDGFEDNFSGYEGVPGYLPEAETVFSFSSKDFARVSADRMFVKMSPYSRTLSYQKMQRRHDLVIGRGYAFKEVLTISVPEGYVIEYLPEAASMSTKLADFSFEASGEGRTVTARFLLRIRAGRIPAEEYDAFRELMKLSNKIYGGTLILRKSEK